MVDRGDEGPPTVAVPAAALGEPDPGDPDPDGARTGDPGSGDPDPDGAHTGDPGSGLIGTGGTGGTRSPLRHRILPRSLLGITSLLLAFSVGAALSGAVLFSYYQYRLDQTNSRVNTLLHGYKKAFANATGDLRVTASQAEAAIHGQLSTLQHLQAAPAVMAKLVQQLAPSVFFVHTLDVNGEASVGTAFVVSSDASESLLLTSYTTVAAATRSPGPPVEVRQGNTDTRVTVRSWDPQYDLALLVLPRGGLRPLSAAPPSNAPQLGDPVYAVSGLGTAGASVAAGAVTDASASGLAEDAPIGAAFQGGPIVTGEGQVLAVASRTYAPLGFRSDGVWYAPYVEAACHKVLHCPNGTLPSHP